MKGSQILESGGKFFAHNGHVKHGFAEMQRMQRSCTEEQENFASDKRQNWLLLLWIKLHADVSSG